MTMTWGWLILIVAGTLMGASVVVQLWYEQAWNRHGRSPLSPDTRDRLAWAGAHCIWLAVVTMGITVVLAFMIMLTGYREAGITTAFVGGTIGMALLIVRRTLRRLGA